MFYEHYFRVASYGIEHVPGEGPTLLVANHAGGRRTEAALLRLDIRVRSEPPRVIAELGDADDLLEHGELVVAWPEGAKCRAHHLRDRYWLGSWHVDFARLAIRHRATIVPVAIVPVPPMHLPVPSHYYIEYGAPIVMKHPPADADDPFAVESVAFLTRTRLERLIQDIRYERRSALR